MIPSLSTATTWINSPPIGAEQLRGKVVLIDFWTYTCINWRRTVPYLRAWVERYGESGLLLVGVHSPEFAFEHDLDNVRQAITQIGVAYPVAVDNDFAIWRAFGNEYWPALYVFDSRGRLRHQVFGEDGYVEAERVIRQLLEEAGRRDPDARPTVVDARGVEKAADWKNLRSPENYVGLRRTENFASPGGSCAASLVSTRFPPSSASTAGLSRAPGPSRTTERRSERPEEGSFTGSTPAT
jgi:thiol-disulfide isomerase/thioredoxin